MGKTKHSHTHRWHLDPSGTYTLYDAKAIGSGSEGAQTSLQEVYHKVKDYVCSRVADRLLSWLILYFIIVVQNVLIMLDTCTSLTCKSVS